LRFEVVSQLEPEADGTRLDLRAETHWPRGLGLLGKLVELAVLSRREGSKELSRLKALVETEAKIRGTSRSPWRIQHIGVECHVHQV
jgi:hypothetical protein